MTKEQRKGKIAAVAEQRSAKQMTYWVSRDRGPDGALSDHVDVWLVLPERVPFDGGVGAYYRVPRPHGPEACVQSASGPVRAHFGTWTLAECLKACRVTPDDDLQVIRVGDDPAPDIIEEVL